MDVPEGASGLHLHCEHCVKLSRCTQSAPVSGERCQLISCPAGCGHRMHHCKLTEHRLLCLEERVPCINSEYGCGVVLARRLRAAHLTSCPASVVLCMAEWNRWPVLSPPPTGQPAEPGPHGPLDAALLERDQRLLRGCLAPARSLARRLRVFPAVPLRLPGTFDCSHLAPELQLDSEAAAEQRAADPPGLQRSVCSQLARTTLATSPSNNLNSDRASTPPEPDIDPYAAKECVHHIAKDMCKLCRHDPAPAREVVRRTWQPGPPDTSGALTWHRVERTEPVRERPGKYDLDAALRRNRQIAAERAAERRRAERDEDESGPRLSLTIDSVAVPERSRPRALYTFQCARPVRRDEFSEHYLRLHGDVHGGAGSWIQQRCPLAQYGCDHFTDRLYPDGPEQRFTVSPVSGCVGVTAVSGSGGDPGGDPGDLEPRLDWLPFEVLQHIASLLDPFSLNHLSLTCRLLRDVCAALLDSRGLVMLLWSPMPYDDGVTWRPVAQSWRFSCAFGPLRRMWFGGGAHMTDHLQHCPYYQPSRATEPFSLFPVKRLGARAGAELEQRMQLVRDSLYRRQDRL